MNDVEQAIADRDYWLDVGKIVDPSMRLYGFTYRHSAAFRTHRSVEIDGKVAARLVELRDMVLVMRESLDKQ
jgi:hypothetical protein